MVRRLGDLFFWLFLELGVYGLVEVGGGGWELVLVF